MKTIAEIEEDPLEFVRWSKTKIAEEHGYDLARMTETLKANEAKSRARGIKFIDFSQPSISYQQAIDHHQSSVVREDPPTLP